MSNSIRELGSIGIDRPIDPSSWNWNKFGSGLRNLGDPSLSNEWGVRF